MPLMPSISTEMKTRTGAWARASVGQIDSRSVNRLFMRRILTAPGRVVPRSKAALERRDTTARHSVIGMLVEPGLEHLDSRLALSIPPSV